MDTKLDGEVGVEGAVGPVDMMNRGEWRAWTSTAFSEILVPRVLWRFENRETVENSKIREILYTPTLLVQQPITLTFTATLQPYIVRFKWAFYSCNMEPSEITTMCIQSDRV